MRYSPPNVVTGPNCPECPVWCHLTRFEGLSPILSIILDYPRILGFLWNRSIPSKYAQILEFDDLKHFAFIWAIFENRPYFHFRRHFLASAGVSPGCWFDPSNRRVWGCGPKKRAFFLGFGTRSWTLDSALGGVFCHLDSTYKSRFDRVSAGTREPAILESGIFEKSEIFEKVRGPTSRFGGDPLGGGPPSIDHL